MQGQEMLGSRNEVPGFHFQCDLSIVEVEILVEDLEHPGVSGVELHPVGK
jgi:hypothetical protein